MKGEFMVVDDRKEAQALLKHFDLWRTNRARLAEIGYEDDTVKEYQQSDDDGIYLLHALVAALRGP